MNMRETITMLQQQVEELKTRIVEQDVACTNISFENKQLMERVSASHDEEVRAIKEAHEKALKSKDDSYKWADDERKALRADIEALQDVMDVIPGVAPREREGQYGSVKVAPMVRLASILASKFA